MYSISISIAGYAFFFGMMMTSLSCKNLEVKEFKDTLNPELLEKYKSITEMRFKIWLEGLVLGIICAVFYLFYFGSKMDRFSRAGIVTTIILFVNYIYYMLYPKNEYMVTQLKNMKQVKEWNDVYKTMQFKYHFGLLLGVFAYFFICLGFFE